MRVSNVNKGYILLLAMAIAAGLSTLTTVMLSRSTTELLAANRSLSVQQAFHLAEAGVDEALSALRTGTINDGALWPAGGTCGPTCRERTLFGLPHGQVRIRVFDAATAAPHIIATASRMSATGPLATSELEVILRKQGQVLPFAAFATHAAGVPGTAPSIYLGPNALIDSYDSRLGPYGLLNKFYDQAKIGTNQDQADPASASIQLNEFAQVGGDASVLSSEHVEVVNAGGVPQKTCAPGSLCGPQVNAVVGLPAPQDFPEIPVPGALRNDNVDPDDNLASGSSNLAVDSVITPGAYDAGNNPTSNCFDIDGARTVTLGTPGSPSLYRFSCLQNLSGNVTILPNTTIYLTREAGWNALVNFATMTAQGKTEIYFHGRISLPFQPISTPPTSKPQDLVFYGVWAGGFPRPDFYLGQASGATVSQIGVVYMPKGWATEIMATGEFFGAIVDGKSESVAIRLMGSLHYDVALRDGFGPGSGQFKIVSWREL